MNFRPPINRDLDIKLTPLIDVVFLLLIFFMVSTTFVKESEIEVNLPQASAELREDLVDRIEIAIDHHDLNGCGFPGPSKPAKNLIGQIRNHVLPVSEAFCEKQHIVSIHHFANPLLGLPD